MKKWQFYIQKLLIIAAISKCDRKKENKDIYKRFFMSGSANDWLQNIIKGKQIARKKIFPPGYHLPEIAHMYIM